MEKGLIIIYCVWLSRCV